MDQNPISLDLARLDKQLAGELSPEEPKAIPDDMLDRDRVLDILARDVGGPEYVGDVPVETIFSESRGWEKIQGLIAGDQQHPMLHTATRHAPAPSSYRSWIVATAVLGCIAAAIVGLREFGSSASEHNATRTFVTARGQQATFRLPDGSTVQLAPASRVEVGAAFGTSERTVTLSGEAVFTVTQHTRAPFTVHAGQSAIHVLGTMFGVRAYATDDSVHVAVAEGKVGIRGGPVLTMGEMIALAPGGMGTVIRGDVVSSLSWTQGRLVYRDVPLERVARDLERWYGLTLQVDGAVAARLVTIEFTEATVTDALKMLARTLGMQYERTGSQITFHHGTRR